MGKDLNESIQDWRFGRRRREFEVWMAKIDAVDEEGVAFLEEPAEESGDEGSVVKEFAPFLETEVGGDDGAFAVASGVHEAEEVVDEVFAGRADITPLVEEKQIDF